MHKWKYHPVKRKSAQEEQEEQTRNIKLEFYIMLSELTSKMSTTPVQEVMAKLPETERRKCSRIKFTEDIFMYDSPLYSELVWNNPILVELMVQSNDECKKIFQDYRSKLFDFLNDRKQPSNNKPDQVHILYDQEWDKDISTQYICTLFQVQEVVLNELI